MCAWHMPTISQGTIEETNGNLQKNISRDPIRGTTGDNKSKLPFRCIILLCYLSALMVHDLIIASKVAKFTDVSSLSGYIILETSPSTYHTVLVLCQYI